MHIHLIKGGEILAVNIENGHNFTVFHYRHHYFAPARTTACNVPWELLHIGYHHGTSLFPCRTTHTFAVSYMDAGQWSLERPQQ